METRTGGLARGRPTTASSPIISNAILEAAAAVFLARGYEKASMEAVALHAGITKRTLYKRFPDKRTLLKAVLQRQCPTWRPLEPDSENLEARLTYYATHILIRGMSPEVRAFHGLAASAWPAPEEMNVREEVLAYRDMVARLEQEIRDRASTLDIAPKDPRVVASALMAMLSGWFDHNDASNVASSVAAATFAKKAVALLIYGKATW